MEYKFDSKCSYNESGKVYEFKRGNDLFFMRSALAYVVDHYDDALNSVELSHYEDLGYNEIVDFKVSNCMLDLTWLKKDDVFLIEKNNQYSDVENVCLNIDNLFYSYLPKDFGKSKNLLLNCNESKLNFIQQYKVFKLFMKKNYKSFNKIYFHGFNPTFQMILQSYFDKCNSKSKSKTLKLTRA